MPPKFSLAIQDKVRDSANFLCEYCHTDEHWQLVQFTIDHVLPLSEGGSDDITNLALACFHCNRQKSNKQIAFDSTTKEPISIFNPRMMLWKDHFAWSSDGLSITPKSDQGRVTIKLLKLNRERSLQLRQDDKLVNRHSPDNELFIHE